MPSFTPAFPGETSGRKISKQELINAIQLDIAAELDAVYLYETHASAIDDEFVKSVLLSVANEEKAHVGEFMSLLYYLDPEYAKHMESGKEEVRNIMLNLNKRNSHSQSAYRPY